MPSKLPPFFMRLRFATATLATWVLNLGMFGERFKVKGLCSPGFNCHGCPWATAACPIGVMAYGSAIHAIPVFAIASILAIGAVLGRLICGFACPAGLLQDLLHRIPSPKIQLPRFFRYGKYATLVLLVAVLPWYVGFKPSGYLQLDKPLVDKNNDGGIDVKVAATNLGTEPVVAPQLKVIYRGLADNEITYDKTEQFTDVTIAPGQKLTLPTFAVPNQLATANLQVSSPQSIASQHAPWHLYYCDLCPVGTLTASIPSIATKDTAEPLLVRLQHNALRLGILAAFLIMMVIASRPLCRLFCPLGAIYSLTSRLSIAGMKRDPAACINCGLCNKVCPMDLNVPKEIGLSECIACGDCRKVCPKNGITRTWGL